MKPIHVLYIEDVEEQRTSLAEGLRARGMEVSLAVSGSEGVKAFDRAVHDVVLCDLNMPGMGGLEVLAEVRQCCRETPFILLTAHGSVPEAVTAIKQGAQHFILKPVDLDELEISIKHAVEHVQLRTKLNESNRSLRRLMRTVPDVVFSINAQGVILDINPAGEAITGYGREELIGAPVTKIIHEEDLARLQGLMEEANDKGAREVKTERFRGVTKSGRIREFEVNRRLVFDDDGKHVRTDGVARDITERVKLERELDDYRRELETKVEERTASLKISNRQLEALNEVSQELSRFTDEALLFEAVPKLLTQSLDFDRAGLMLAGREGLQLVAHEFTGLASKLAQPLLDGIKSGRFNLPSHFMRSFREDKTVLVPNIWSDVEWPDILAEHLEADAAVITPIRVKGRPIGILVANMRSQKQPMDSSDIARFETFAAMVGLTIDNVRSYQTLETQVVERTRSLQEAYQNLKDTQAQLVQSEKMASLGILVAGIAHEINTPIGAVNSMHNTQLRAYAKLKAAISSQCDISCEAAEQLEPLTRIIDDANRVIQTGVERVTTIVRRLRSFARLDEAELKTADVHEGIEDTLTLIYHEIKNRIKVDRRYGEVPPISCYPGRLNQVFLNLLNNARQAIPAEGTITISTGVKDKKVVIEFSDTGVGIPPEKLKRIFDPGFTTKGVGVGTGLGLSICFQIIEDHRGTITAASTVGEGTTMTITLPMNLGELLDNA